MDPTKENKVLVMPNRSRLAEVLKDTENPVDVFARIENPAADSSTKANRATNSSTSPAAETSTQAESGARVQQLPIEEIAFSSYQIRQVTNERELEALASSITSKGVLQPILVRIIDPDEDREESFELIAGERRLRAARLAGLTVVPSLIVQLDDRETLEAAIVENAQRENLNAIEEARAFQRLSNEFSLTQREIAEAVGKNRSTISNALRLLQLDPRIVELIAENQLSAGHGRALLMLDEPTEQCRFAKRAVNQGLSVHALEKKIARHLEGSEEEELSDEEERELARLSRQRDKVANLLDLEEVAMSFDTQGRRRLNLVFETEASWKRFMARIRD